MKYLLSAHPVSDSEKLLYEVFIVSTPGVGFGPSGEGYLRLTAFGDHDDTIEAIQRIQHWMR